MLQAKPFTFGRLSGTAYDLPEAGDVLPMHPDCAADGPIRVLTLGICRAHGHGWARVLNAR